MATIADLATLPAGAFLLPGAAAISEFQGFTGDCGQTAALAAAHVASPDHPNLSAENLDADVKAQIAAGLAGSSGAEPLSSVARLLDTYHVSYQLIPYHEPFADINWHQILLDTFHATGGRQPGPVVMQVANAQALHGDEPGVHYHFVTILGICPAGYYTADGDNSAAKTNQLVVYSWAELAAAVPCGLILCHMPASPPPPPPPPPAPAPAPAPPAQPSLAEQLAALAARVSALEGRLAKLVYSLQQAVQ